jgi:hypothetical protein
VQRKKEGHHQHLRSSMRMVGGCVSDSKAVTMACARSVRFSRAPSTRRPCTARVHAACVSSCSIFISKPGPCRIEAKHTGGSRSRPTLTSTPAYDRLQIAMLLTKASARAKGAPFHATLQKCSLSLVGPAIVLSVLSGRVGGQVLCDVDGQATCSVTDVCCE